MDEVLQGVGKFLQADVPISIVSAFLAFLFSFFLPAPSAKNGETLRWYMVHERWKVIPMVVAFFLGLALGVWLDLDAKELLVSKVRGGFQTGVMAVGLYYPIRMSVIKVWGTVAPTVATPGQ